MKVRNWKQFGKYIRPNGSLLIEIDRLQNPILVSGCQRSGGTMLARVISSHQQMADFGWSKDVELDAAQFLAGNVDLDITGRVCLQSTYLNEQYHEYYNISTPFKLIWLVRNPYSVIYSMLHNWSRFALNELFHSCGVEFLRGQERADYGRWGLWKISPLKRACYSYLGKVKQLCELRANLPNDSMLVLEYEALIRCRESTLRMICDFADLEFAVGFGAMINDHSLGKAEKISHAKKCVIEQLCESYYQRALQIAEHPI
ncbi:MAG: sulfotransferase [Pseudomonadales bacterium]|nr:sulfotransferase [Pseudomonadales bacterium]